MEKLVSGDTDHGDGKIKNKKYYRIGSCLHEPK